MPSSRMWDWPGADTTPTCQPPNLEKVCLENLAWNLSIIHTNEVRLVLMSMYVYSEMLFWKFLAAKHKIHVPSTVPQYQCCNPSQFGLSASHPRNSIASASASLNPFSKTIYAPINSSLKERLPTVIARLKTWFYRFQPMWQTWWCKPLDV